MEENRERTKRALAALRAVDQQRMGRVAGGMGAEATDRLADLDDCTTAYRHWNPSLVPGVLQTPAYAAGAIKVRTPSLDDSEIERRVRHRRRRTEAFLAKRTHLMGPLAWFIVGEAAIKYPTASSHVHAQQLQELLDITEQYFNIKIQVMRSGPVRRVVDEPFSIFSLDPGPVVGHLESVIGSWYTVASEDIARLHAAFSDLMGLAMGWQESREFIMEELTCWGPTTGQSSSNPRTATPTVASTSPVPPPARLE